MIPVKDHFTYEIIYNTYSLSQALSSSKLLRFWDKERPLYDEQFKYWYLWKGLEHSFFQQILIQWDHIHIFRKPRHRHHKLALTLRKQL